MQLVAAIAGAFGIKKWRDKYAQYKTWMQSKSKLGAIMFSLPLIALGVIMLFDFQIAEWIKTVLLAIAAAGGLPLLLGIADAVKEEKRK